MSQNKRQKQPLKPIAETSTRRPFFRKRDLWVVLAMVLLAVFLLILGYNQSVGTVLVARIYYHDRLIAQTELLPGVEKDFQFPENPEVLIHQYNDQTIAFVVSDCNDQICVRTGKIGRAGEFSACVPNGFLIVISRLDGEGTDVDLIV